MSDSPSSTRAWWICGILLLATMLNYMDRTVLSVTLPELKATYNLAEERVGKLEGYFGFSFAFGSLFFGMIADRTGPRFLYPLVLAGWSLAGMATSWASSPWVAETFQSPGESDGTGVFRWLLYCRIVLGLCEAGHWPCALLTVRAILTADKRTLGNGILQSGASIGAVLVPLYIQFSDEILQQSWEFPFWTIGLAGFLWIPLWFWATRGLNLTRVMDAATVAKTPSSAPQQTKDSANVVVRLVVLAIVIATLTVSWQFLRAWLALLLQDHLGYSKRATRFLVMGYYVSADVGCILSGLLVARLTMRGISVHLARLRGYQVFALLSACAALAPFVPDGWIMVALLYAAAAGTLGLHPYYYALTQEISAKNMGFLSGLLAAFGWCVSSVFQIYVGKRIEATNSYELALVIAGLAPMLGLACLMLFWPTKHSEDDPRSDARATAA